VGLKLGIQAMPVLAKHLALDRRAYRCRRELGIMSLKCVGANESTVINTGTGSMGPGWVKGGDGAAYVMPD